jgi:hypothetical protein
LLQAGVGVGDDELDAGQPTGLERAQERRPEGAVFGVADVQAEDLLATVDDDPGGDHDCTADHPAIHPGLEVGGVHEPPAGRVALDADRGGATAGTSTDR